MRTDFCGDDCREIYESHYALVKKYGAVFLLGTLGPMVLLIPGFIFIEYLSCFAAVICFIFAVTIKALPFCPQEHVNDVGLKETIRICKQGAVIMTIIGLSLLLFQFVIFIL